MSSTIFTVLSLLVVTCAAQRSPYAGRSPIGYPALAPTTVDPLGNRFGEDTSGTTIRLPIEAMGDVEFYKRMLKLPIDQQPFWVINWKQLEANRKKPQTYNPRENSFIDMNNLNLRG